MMDVMVRNRQDVHSSTLNVKSLTIATSLMTVCSVNAVAVDVNRTFVVSQANSICLQSVMDTESLFSQENYCVFVPRKSYRDRYRKLGKTEWFRKAYHDMSVGEIMEIE